MSLCEHGLNLNNHRCDRCEEIAAAEHTARSASDDAKDAKLALRDTVSRGMASLNTSGAMMFVQHLILTATDEQLAAALALTLSSKQPGEP